MKNLTYLPVAWACAGLCAALCLTLTLFPVLIFWLFDLVASPAATVLAKRAGVLFFGLSLLMFLTRHHGVNPTRLAVQTAVAVMLGVMALLGAAEWWRGAIGVGVWLAIIVELLFAGALLRAR